MAQNLTTVVERDMRGALRAETVIALGFDRRELRVVTGKSHNPGIYCSARVVQGSADDLSYSYIMHQDYSKVLAREPNTRATEKNIRAMHQAALANIDAVLAEVFAQYAPAGAA